MASPVTPVVPVGLFASAETLMLSYLTAEEKALYADGIGTVNWVAPATWAVILRHWVLSVVFVGATLVGLFFLWQLGLGSVGAGFCGVALMTASISLGLLELHVSFRRYTRYVVTPSRIVRMDGIVNRKVSSIGWDKITDVSEIVGVAGQMFDFGDISVETANENSSFGMLKDVPSPWLFRTKMAQAQGALAEPPGPTPLNVAALEALLSLGSVITEGSLVIQPLPGTAGWSVSLGTPPPSPPE